MTRHRDAVTQREEREFNDWRERMRKPEERFRLFGMLAVACAFVGDEEKTKEYATYAERERPFLPPGHWALNNEPGKETV